MRKSLFASASQVFLIILICGSCKKESPDPVMLPNVLIYSQTKAYRHECIEPGTAAMEIYFKNHGLNTMHSEDSSMISTDHLKPFDVVIFFQTTGNILDSLQQVALQKFIQSGKGFVGIHAAADTEYDWTWYTSLVGAQFSNHPDIQSGTIVKSDTTHAACKHLPVRWTRTDEWYNFKQAPTGVQVLLKMDETTYQGGTMGENHPMTWCHTYDGGRSFYTALGHTVESYQDTLFLEHLLMGVKWAAAR